MLTRKNSNLDYVPFSHVVSFHCLFVYVYQCLWVFTTILSAQYYKGSSYDIFNGPVFKPEAVLKSCSQKLNFVAYFSLYVDDYVMKKCVLPLWFIAI